MADTPFQAKRPGCRLRIGMRPPRLAFGRIPSGRFRTDGGNLASWRSAAVFVKSKLLGAPRHVRSRCVTPLFPGAQEPCGFDARSRAKEAFCLGDMLVDAQRRDSKLSRDRLALVSQSDQPKAILLAWRQAIDLIVHGRHGFDSTPNSGTARDRCQSGRLCGVTRATNYVGGHRRGSCSKVMIGKR